MPKKSPKDVRADILREDMTALVMSAEEKHQDPPPLPVRLHALEFIDDQLLDREVPNPTLYQQEHDITAFWQLDGLREANLTFFEDHTWEACIIDYDEDDNTGYLDIGKFAAAVRRGIQEASDEGNPLMIYQGAW